MKAFPAPTPHLPPPETKIVEGKNDFSIIW